MYSRRKQSNRFHSESDFHPPRSYVFASPRSPHILLGNSTDLRYNCPENVDFPLPSVHSWVPKYPCSSLHFHATNCCPLYCPRYQLSLLKVKFRNLRRVPSSPNSVAYSPRKSTLSSITSKWAASQCAVSSRGLGDPSTESSLQVV